MWVFYVSNDSNTMAPVATLAPVGIEESNNGNPPQVLTVINCYSVLPITMQDVVSTLVFAVHHWLNLEAAFKMECVKCKFCK